jgi:hypothetical protein
MIDVAQLLELEPAALRRRLAAELEQLADATGDAVIRHAGNYLNGMAYRDNGAIDDAELLAELGRGITPAELRANLGLTDSDLRRLRRKRAGHGVRTGKSAMLAHDRKEQQIDDAGAGDGSTSANLENLGRIRGAYPRAS